jgi:choline dehydrogenase
MIPIRPLRKSYDYVIVGGGSAGCVLANRLSSDEQVTVLLLEAGPKDGGLLMTMPAAVYRIYQEPSINWNYSSEPEAMMKQRRIPVPRGKVLGGSSSINAMVYLRGHPKDYDSWADDHDLPGWSFAHCLPYFRKSEASDRGPSLYHGADGPLSVEQSQLKSEIFDAFIAAAAEAGHAITDDLNGPKPEGIGRMDATKRRGRRCSAAVGYLHPVAERKNLDILTNVHVERVITRGTKAIGVEAFTTDRVQIEARREVLLCAGAINSPQLLMVSGIGPEDELRRHGIKIVQNADGVGRNLQDHLNVGLSFRCKEAISLSWLDSPLGKAFAGAQWFLNKTGPVASNIWELGGLFRSSDDVDYPNFQYHVGPVLTQPRPDGRLSLADGFMVHMAQLRQESRGRLQLQSASTRDAPLIKFGFFATERDKKEFRDALQVTRHILDQKPIREIGSTELVPGSAIRTDAEVDDFIATNTNTEFHPSCTCRMGGDQAAVIDGEMRVNGIERLRVIDASVMPTVPSCNLNATTIMIAEKGADMVLGRPPLPPSDLGSQHR